MFAKLINGNLQRLRTPIKTDGKDIFTTDDNIIKSNGYKTVVYTNTPSDTAVPSWQETETQIIQTWAESL